MLSLLTRSVYPLCCDQILRKCHGSGNPSDSAWRRPADLQGLFQLQLKLHKSICHKRASVHSLDASSGTLNATWQVTNVFRGREVLGLWSCWNEWPPWGDLIKSPASTLSQEWSFQVLGWEHSLGGSRIRERGRALGLVDLGADPTPLFPNWDSEQGV